MPRGLSSLLPTRTGLPSGARETIRDFSSQMAAGHISGRPSRFPRRPILRLRNWTAPSRNQGSSWRPPSPWEALTEFFEDRIVEQQTVEWDRRSRSVLSRRQILIGKAVLKTVSLSEPEPDRVAKAMCEGIRQMGIEVLPWTKPLRAWQARVLLMKKVHAGGNPWPDLSDTHLSETLESWILPYLSGISRREQLPRLDLKGALTSLLSRRLQTALDRMAPTHIMVPSGSRIPISYTNGDAPVLAVRLQEMFGALDTPVIADGTLPLLLHLLSPAGHPVQVTQNLKSFWETTYFEVKKELKGRYPKHHWPDNPLEAAPTNRTKKRPRH